MTKEELMAMDYNDLIKLQSLVNEVSRDKDAEMSERIKVGLLVSKPGNHGTIYYLVTEVYPVYVGECCPDEFYAKCATYFVRNDGKPYFRGFEKYELDQAYTSLNMHLPDTKTEQTTLEDYEAEHAIEEAMIGILERHTGINLNKKATDN